MSPYRFGLICCIICALAINIGWGNWGGFCWTVLILGLAIPGPKARARYHERTSR